jgi:hypothetical protein
LALSQLDGAPTYNDPVDASRSALEAQAYAEASNRGMITESGAYDPQRTSDENGNTYGWFSPENNSMNLTSNPGEKQNEQVHDWANSLREARTENGETVYPEATDIFNNTDKSIDGGMNSGRARVSGEDGVGKDSDSGSVKIKR